MIVGGREKETSNILGEDTPEQGGGSNKLDLDRRELKTL